MTQSILITGASTGIGKAAALLLDKSGYRVFAGVRKEKDAETLRAQGTKNLQPIILDVMNTKHIDQAFEQVQAATSNKGLKALINNAGYNYIEPFEMTDETKARAMMETNFFGLYKMSQRFLPLLRAYTDAHSDQANLINVGSIGSRIGFPWESFYHASKFAVLGFSESLRFELATQRIAVSAVLPGGIKTEFIGKALGEINAGLEKFPVSNPYHKGLAKYAAMLPQAEKFGSPPEKVGQEILRILQTAHPRLKYFVGTDAKIFNAMARFLPESWVHAIIRSQFIAS
ncbi:MAG: SDR family NAD(P)-dependent oxidoreductase [Rhizobacter sp.]|nr:SDR family NAD(P)-dependent oxidoreductase [Chlorobiales bacterium]